MPVLLARETVIICSRGGGLFTQRKIIPFRSFSWYFSFVSTELSCPSLTRRRLERYLKASLDNGAYSKRTPNNLGSPGPKGSAPVDNYKTLTNTHIGLSSGAVSKLRFEIQMIEHHSSNRTPDEPCTRYIIGFPRPKDPCTRTTARPKQLLILTLLLAPSPGGIL